MVEAKDSVALVKDQRSLNALSWQSPCLAGLMLWVPSPARCKNQRSDVRLLISALGKQRRFQGHPGGYAASLKAAWASGANLPCFMSCLAFLVVSVSLGTLSSNFDPKHHLLLSELEMEPCPSREGSGLCEPGEPSLGFCNSPPTTPT